MDDSLNSLREKRKRHTKAEIVRVAFDLFGKHGFDKVPVEMICAEAGISRATFFNYFPQKELILSEIAHARVAKVKEILAGFTANSHKPAFADLVNLFLEISKENARLGRNSKQLMLETVLRQGMQGNLLPVKREGTKALAETIERIPGRRTKDPQLAADTLFAIYIATTLEWLMQESASPAWLQKTMRDRLQLALEGVA